MILRLLDPDCKSTWIDFETMVYGPEVWQKINAILDSGEEQNKIFLNQLTCAEDSLKDKFARSLRQKGKEILCSSYTHVAGYHGCRPRDPTSYQFNGIHPSNTEDLISDARSLFEGIGDFDKEIQNILKQYPYYLNHNEGKIWLLFSALRAKDEHNSYAKGSELIRGIANRLGPLAVLRFANTENQRLLSAQFRWNG